MIILKSLCCHTHLLHEIYIMYYDILLPVLINRNKKKFKNQSIIFETQNPAYNIYLVQHLDGL